MNKKNQKGITLIALVITIIVILILSTVSINAVLSNQGILKSSQEIERMQNEAIEAEKQSNNKTLAEHTNVIENPPKDPTANWDTRKVDKILSEDNIFVPVPKGYTASTVEGEKKVSTGFVIKEGTNGNAKTGINEYVWVPVSNIDDIYDEENNAGQLWDFTGTTSTKKAYPSNKNSSYREPDVVTRANEGEESTSGSEYDAVTDNLKQAGLPDTSTAKEFKAQLQKEFENMVESVRIYGGFYIGRYETGNLSQTTAVVQKYNTDIGNQTWYTQYKLSKTIGANSNVTTSMIWGCQWDATLRWMQTSSDEKVKNFPTNSAAYGNYSDNTLEYKESEDGETKTQVTASSVIPTGSSETTNINNIYDMAGNVFDWTIETMNLTSRAYRGRNFGYKGIDSPAYDRQGNSPVELGNGSGSRSTLYINP